MNYFEKRRIRKNAREIMRQARHLRNLMDDLLDQKKMAELNNAEKALVDVMNSDDLVLIQETSEKLYSVVSELTPRYSCPGLRENLEVLVVAVAIAMAFRTYFLQPFKIPTGSMQPTLYGITYEDMAESGWSDHMPVKLVKWFFTGEWYVETKAQVSGVLRYPVGLDGTTGADYCFIGDVIHRVPRGHVLACNDGSYVKKGDVLWSGIRMAGDHIFVNKVSWNFRKPTIGEIVVFRTDDIPIEPQVPKGTHYIKRLCGLPGNEISIQPPYLVIDGQPVMDSAPIRRVTETTGYRLAPHQEALIRTQDEHLSLGPGQYVAFGDNTLSSKDSRYWGYIPQDNLVGPALLVYWPFSRRWGVVDR